MESLSNNGERVGAHETENSTDLALRILDQANATPVELAPQPERCRAILISADAMSVAAVKRTRPGVDPYAVLPGGGLEMHDATPVAGVLRELQEELSLSQADVALITDKVISMDNQWVYVGIVSASVESFTLDGPELERNQAQGERGTYEPAWIPIADILEQNVVPANIREIIMGAASQSNQ